MSNELGETLVRKWQSRMGFSHFRIVVQPMPENHPDAWAQSFFELEEEWGVIELPADELFPPATLELLVVHELAHGLLQLARMGKHMSTEAVCNRIARLALNDYVSPLMNEHQAAVVGDAWFKAGKVDRRKWLNIVADALPAQEREIVSLTYWGGMSIRQVADQLGMSKSMVDRKLRGALEMLAQYFDALDKEYGS